MHEGMPIKQNLFTKPIKTVILQISFHLLLIKCSNLYLRLYVNKYWGRKTDGWFEQIYPVLLYVSVKN